MEIKFSKAISLLNEADILLFRAKKNIFSISYWIAKASFSEYSHVSIVSLSKDGPECLEFREWVGSRKHLLSEELAHGNIIDVFRLNRSISNIKFSEKTGQVEQTIIEFDSEIAKRITDNAKEHISRKETYAYNIIWKISAILVPLYRLWVNRNPPVEPEVNKFVCSTFVSYLFRKHITDLCIGISDEYTTPGDLSRSNVVNYLFTIVKD